MRILNRVIQWLEKQNVIRVSRESRISGTARITGSRLFGNIDIESHARVMGGVEIHSESKVRIGRFSAINGPNTDIHAYVNEVNIGAFTSIARNVSIQEFNHKYLGLSTYLIRKNLFGQSKTQDIKSNGAVNIGNDVWIGTQSVILGGVTIADGAIIGANSVVTTDIPPYAMAVGSPAKVINYRFDAEIIDALLKLQWWNWPIEKILKNEKFFEKESISLEYIYKMLHVK